MRKVVHEDNASEHTSGLEALLKEEEEEKLASMTKYQAT